MLADHLVVADGKLYANGVGWSFINPENCNFCVGGLLEVPWSEANRKHRLDLQFLDADGRPVLDPAGNPIGMQGDVEVGRPAGHPDGVPFTVPLPVVQLAGLRLSPGARYVWQLAIDGKTSEQWTVGFSTLAEPPAT